jgi:hypothetical protein
VQHGAGVALIDPVTAHYAAGRVLVKPFEPAISSVFSVLLSNQHPPSQLALAFVAYAKARMAEMFPADDGAAA